MADLLLIGWTDRCVIQERSSLLIGTVGVIDRENDAIRTHNLQGDQQRWISEEATIGNMKVAQKVLRDAPLQMPCLRCEGIINTGKHEREHFPHMPNDDLQGWQAVEHPSQDQSQGVN